MKISSSFLLSNRRASLASRGFSLVEVVLAVGIMALGVVTILGLLPHGMDMSRKTANEQAESRIIELLVGELQTSDWDVLNERVSDGAQRHYFNDQGLEVPDDHIDLAYVAEVEVKPLDVTLPTNAASITENQNLRRVVVRVVSAPLPDVNFESPPPGVPLKTFTQLVAKMR